MIAVTRHFQCLDGASHLHRKFWTFFQSSTRCLQKMAETSPPSQLVYAEPSNEEVIARLRKTDITELLASLPAPPASGTTAAVLVPLFRIGGQLRVLLTLRSNELSSHKGDVAFPGGKRDPEDVDARATALREAQEEVGLSPGEVRIVSQLGTSMSYRSTLIYPVVGFIPDDFRPVPNLAEVQDVFSVPLVKFLQSENHWQRDWRVGDKTHPIKFFRHSEAGKTFVPYGLTARICIITASICYGRLPEFEFESPYDAADPKKYFQVSQAKYMAQLKDMEKKASKL